MRSPRRSQLLVDWSLAAFILLVAGTLAFTSAAQDSQTYDEGVHLVSGYSYWKTGDFRLSPEHPPLSKLIVSLPLLWLQPDFSPDPEHWQKADPWPIGQNFLYSNRIPADSMIMSARVVVILMYLAVAASIAWWVRSKAGRAAGFVALLLFAFEPTVLAHGRYVTTDIPVTLFIWLAWIAWCAYLQSPTSWKLIATGVLTGMAFATKFSALFLPIAFALTLTRASTVRWWRIPIVTGIAMGIALATYAFSAQSVAEDPTLFTRSLSTGNNELVAKAIQFKVPGYYFLRGIHMLIRHQFGGYPAYFMGEISSHGTWQYFPVALILKSPVSWLIVLLMGGAIAFLHRMKNEARLLAIPAVVYLAIALTSSFNIGIRHLLPVYPFLCAFAAIALFRVNQSPKVRTAATLLLALFLAESATAYPHYLSFFNVAAGGTAKGHRYIADSNLDWGQDLKRLRKYMASNGIETVCLSYFGTADPASYGIHHQPVPSLKTLEDIEGLNCVVAISVQHLYASPSMTFTALHDLRPADRVGGSILIFDLRH